MIPKSVMKRDQIMSNMVDNDAHMFSWKGEDKRILVYPVDYDQQYSVTCTYPSSLSNLHQIDENLATAVGMCTRAPDSLHSFPKLTCSRHSIQSKDLFERRSQHI